MSHHAWSWVYFRVYSYHVWQQTYVLLNLSSEPIIDSPSDIDLRFHLQSTICVWFHVCLFAQPTYKGAAIIINELHHRNVVPATPSVSAVCIPSKSLLSVMKSKYVSLNIVVSTPDFDTVIYTTNITFAWRWFLWCLGRWRDQWN